MPLLPSSLRKTAFLLLFVSVMTMIAGTSSVQQREVVSSEAVPPAETVVVDSIGDLPTSTRFDQRHTGGFPLNERLSAGPEFMLTQPTTIIEIGGYVESCYGMSRGKLIEPCDPVPAVTVNIHPQSNGKPDITTVIASYTLSNDTDRTLVSYESVKVNLTLPPGTYYAIFNNPSRYGLLMSQGFYPNKQYLCRVIPMVQVYKDLPVSSSSRQYIAVRILKETD